MHNHMHLHDTWEAYRKQVRQLRDTYTNRMKQLERYADSEKGKQDMEKAEKDFRDGLAALADSYRGKFDSIIQDTAAEKEQDMKEVGVTLSPWEYRMRWYGEEESIARARAAEIGTGAVSGKE